MHVNGHVYVRVDAYVCVHAYVHELCIVLIFTVGYIRILGVGVFAVLGFRVCIGSVFVSCRAGVPDYERLRAGYDRRLR